MHAGAAVIVLLILVAIFAPLIVALLGHPPLDFHYEKIDPDLQVANGPWPGSSRTTPSAWRATPFASRSSWRSSASPRSELHALPRACHLRDGARLQSVRRRPPRRARSAVAV